MRLVYSVEAVADLTRLRAFIATHDPASAARVGEELVTRIALAARFPEMGKGVPSAPDPAMLRDAIFGNYIARYTIHPGLIVVLRIWHQLEARDADT